MIDEIMYINFSVWKQNNKIFNEQFLIDGIEKNYSITKNKDF